MGTVSGKLVINRPVEKDETETRPTEETNGGPVQEDTAEIVKGNVDLDVPLIDDVAETHTLKLEETAVQPTAETVDDHQPGEPNHDSGDEPNGDLAKTADQAGDETGNKTGSTPRKSKNPFVWIQRRVSRKSQAKRQKKQQQAAPEEQENKEVETAAATEPVTAADEQVDKDTAGKETAGLVEEIMTSPAVVAHANGEGDVPSSPVNGSVSATISEPCPSEIAIVQELPQISKVTEHEQPSVELVAESVDDESSEKQHVQIINVSPAVIEEMHQAAAHQPDQAEGESSVENSEETANGGEHFQNHIAADSKKLKLNGDGVPNGVHVNGDGDHQEDLSSDAAVSAKLASLDLSNGACESNLPTDLDQELRCEPVA